MERALQRFVAVTSKETILIVDDEPNQRRVLRIALEELGFEVCEAADGREALDVLDTREVDVAVVDLMMPELDGAELMRRMRFRHPSVPVILTSAYHLNPIQMERGRLDAVGFLPKPFEVSDLLALVRSASQESSGVRATPL